MMMGEVVDPRAYCPPDIPSDVYNKQMFALVPTLIILVLSIVTYGLRVFCRHKTGQRLGWDDWLMGIGLLISIEPAICEFLLLANGLGHHICNVPPAQAQRFGVITFALQRANQPALVCVKLSIVIFYMRIFERGRFRVAAHCVNAYNIAWGISTWIVNLTVCTPVAFYYDHTIKGGSCRNQAVSGSVSGGLSLLGDLLVLGLPLPMIWGLKINWRKKASIAGIFLLGCFVCVASVIRIIELVQFTPMDATYSQVYTSTWTDLEQGVAVISGNLPLLAPLFDGWLRNRGAYYGSGSGSGSGGRGAKYGGRSGYGFGGGRGGGRGGGYGAASGLRSASAGDTMTSGSKMSRSKHSVKELISNPSSDGGSDSGQGVGGVNGGGGRRRRDSSPRLVFTDRAGVGRSAHITSDANTKHAAGVVGGGGVGDEKGPGRLGRSHTGGGGGGIGRGGHHTDWLSDDSGGRTPTGSLNEPENAFEMDDRAVLVTTQITVTNQPHGGTHAHPYAV